MVSSSPGQVDFAIALVNSVLNLPDQQVIFWGNSNYRRTANNPAHQFFFFRIAEMTFGLVQAVKLTFIASWLDEIITFSKY